MYFFRLDMRKRASELSKVFPNYLLIFEDRFETQKSLFQPLSQPLSFKVTPSALKPTLELQNWTISSRAILLASLKTENETLNLKYQLSHLKLSSEMCGERQT